LQDPKYCQQIEERDYLATSFTILYTLYNMGEMGEKSSKRNIKRIP
jgi:hypothetical protein